MGAEISKFGRFENVQQMRRCVKSCHWSWNNDLALAGIRVGYGAFPLELASYIWRAKQPYNVSVAAEVAACAALSNPDYMKVKNLFLMRQSCS